VNRTELERRAQLWQRHRTLRTSALAGTFGLLVASVLVRTAPAAAIIGAVVTLVLTTHFLRRRTRTVTAATLAAHLNRLCPALEESAGLWLREPSTLTLVETLQLRRLNRAWDALPDRAILGGPRAGALRPAVGLCFAAALALVGAVLWPHANVPAPLGVQPPRVVSIPPPASTVPALRAAALLIEPPSYLGESSRRVEGLDTEVPEGSVVTWELAITGDATGVSLLIARRKDPVIAEAMGGGRFRVRMTIAETQLYQLSIDRDGGKTTIWPELHVVKAIRDLPPRLTWQEPAASRTVVDPAAGPPLVAVRLGAVDDHGVGGVTLVMTVAKGSGEGVKFREQEITLDRLGNVAATGASFGHTLDLAALGLEPGDELYFHAIAIDRRTPLPNRTRSETRFVALRGPATELAAPPVGLAGINRLPQYFRSQRQLIIDTELLVAERARLTEEVFRERSEEIGIDQKLLRLRYGQFLGEEFEPASSGAPKEAQGMALAGALRGQSRETLSRAAAVERAVEAQHVHPPAVDRGGRPPTVEELMAPFMHVHDNAEAATLFDTHVKTALRAVLAAMWDAEGFLRTGRPAEALPAENRALELLKALQQADRVYVKRVGHEPAPIKIDERRLRGELTAIPKRAQETALARTQNADVAAVATALAAFGDAAMSTVPDEIATVVEAQLVAKAQERPEAYLAALELWRRRATSPATGDRAALRQVLWSLLPPASETPHRRDEAAPAIARRYFESLGVNPGRAQ
jgi:hypothetical protein